MAPEVMVPVPVVILAFEVVNPPGIEAWRPARPRIRPDALVPAMATVPVVPVAVPVSMTTPPEFEVAPVALPVFRVMPEELVEAVLVAAVTRDGDWTEPVMSGPVILISPVWGELAPADWTKTTVPERSENVTVRAAVAEPVNLKLLAALPEVP